jgi:hypothetical protein
VAVSTASEHSPELVGPVHVYLQVSSFLHRVVLDGPGGVSAVGQNGAIVAGGVHITVVLLPIVINTQSSCVQQQKTVFFFQFSFFFLVLSDALTVPHLNMH